MRNALISHTLRRRRLLLWLAGLFAIFSLAGFLLAPVLLKKQLIKHGSAALHRPVSIEEVRLNPWTLSLTVRGLVITAHDGAEFAGWDELFVDFAPVASLARLTWTFDQVRLVHPRGRVYREADGTLNIADLIPPAVPKPATQSAKPSAPPAVAVAHLRVERGEFTHADKARSAPFSTTFGPTSFELTDFTTRPNRSGAYTFAATTEAGEHFAWKGSLTFEPLGSVGRIEITDLALPKYAAYYRDFLRFDLASGQLGLIADYELALAANEPVVRLRDASATLAGLTLNAPGSSAPFLSIPELRVETLTADSAARTASIARVLVTGAALTAERRTDGSLDLVGLLTPKLPTSQPEQKPETASSPWSATLGTLEIADASLRLTDHSTPRPASVAIDQLGVIVHGVSTQLDREVSLTTTLRWNESGHLTLSGKIRPQPRSATLQVEAAGLALRPLDPYLAPFLNLLITNGTARAKGQLTLALTAAGAPDLRWTGDAGLAAFAAVDGEFSEPLFGFTDLAFTKINATTQPLAVALDEIAVKEPYAHVIIAPDRQLNFSAVVKGPRRPTQSETVAQASLPAVPDTAKPTAPSPHASAEASVSKPETRNPKPSIIIGRVTLAGARVTATDRSVEPAFTTELADFGGTISDLSSEQLARADVELTGRLGLAPLRISGKINPLSGDAYTDLKVAFTGIELRPFAPYSGRYAGYAIDKGKLSFDLGYHLSARELVGENKVMLDQFFLGEPIASPDATKLPIKLALALLRDRDGRITLELPVRGNLDDPDFKYGRIVWETLGNVIVKAATAPFAMLGGLFGAGHDLSAVDFASGSAELTPEALARLDGLIKALTERPGLSLEISSQPQPELDLAGLRTTQLDTLLRASKLRDFAATTTAAADPATVPLTPEERVRYLAELHAERCTTMAVALGAETTRTTGAVAPTQVEPPKGNLIVRNMRRLFGRGTKPAVVAAGPKAGTSVAPKLGSRNAKPDTVAAVVAAPLTPEEQWAQVLATLTPEATDYADLAARRAQRIQEYLLTKGQVEAARVFLASGGVPPASESSAVPRVVFNLK
ncbi:MAG: DUF748 domain-containing protein [Opitutaceae bacterium]|nr:DUF748 domain-containing protein [Opitutaceae bacterium]